jgi:hypothetical protein
VDHLELESRCALTSSRTFKSYSYSIIQENTSPQKTPAFQLEKYVFQKISKEFEIPSIEKHLAKIHHKKGTNILTLVRNNIFLCCTFCTLEDSIKSPRDLLISL